MCECAREAAVPASLAVEKVSSSMHNTIEEEEYLRVATMGGEHNHQEQETPGNEASEQIGKETIHIHY
jgi:hypothetical protein